MEIANMKVATRLGIGFGLLLLLLMTIAALGVFNMNRINGRLNEIVHDNVVKLSLLQEMSEAVHVVARVTRTVVLLQEEPAKRQELAKLEAARSQYDKASAALNKMAASAAGLEIRARIEAARQAARPQTDRVLALALAGQGTEATALLMQQAGPATQRWQEAMDENMALQKHNNTTDADEAAAAYSLARTLMLALSALAVVAGAVAAVVIARKLLRQLGGEPDYAAMVAGRIAAGWKVCSSAVSSQASGASSTTPVTGLK